MTKLTLEQQELLFANDCKLINLRYEYHGYTGTEKWAIVTELAEEELWVKYPDVIRRYTPFILLSMAQGEVIDESCRNNDKYEKRAKRTIDVYGYEDDISEQFHRELITPFVDPFEQAEEERIEEEKEQLRQLEIAKVRKVLEMLKPVQRERLIKAILLGMSSRKIAKEEGVYYSVVDMYETFVRNQIGSKTVSSLKKTDIKRFYNYLADERHLKPATIDNIHTVLHQILDMAVDDDYLRNNPSNNVLKELKQSHCFQTEKRRALTRPEQELFLSYLKNTPSASLWYPIFAVLVGTGLRVGEATGLRWCDIDLDEGIINVNHTLVYYDHRTDGSKRGCYFNINTTKTPAGKRQVPMLDFVKEAFLMEKERQELLDIHCEAVVDGYTDFIFLNRFGQPQHQATLNKAIRRIIRDCNDEQFLKDENAKVLLPHFSCHSLRHTFTTRMCEAGVNVKVIQDTLGHKDISTTLNIYTDVTKELRRSEFEGLDSYFKNEYNKANEVL